MPSRDPDTKGEIVRNAGPPAGRRSNQRAGRSDGAGGASGRDEEAVRRFVEHMAMTFANWGFPRMAARVLMLLMAADETHLTAAEVADRLQISPAAVSGALRYLQQLSLVTREPVPGSRRDRYRLPDDVWYQGSIIKGGLFSIIAKLSAEGVEAAGGRDTPAGARIGQMGDFYDFLQAELGGILARWDARLGDPV